MQVILEKRKGDSRVAYCGLKFDKSKLVSRLEVPLEYAVKGYDIWVHENHRGKGLGKELLSEAIKLAKWGGSLVLEIGEVLEESKGFYIESLREAMERGHIYDFIPLDNSIHVLLEPLDNFDRKL